jgi:hypothetical protein
MISNNSNADLLQVSSCLVVVTKASVILAEHPEWDTALKRLVLPSLTQMETIDCHVDHLNTSSWIGDIQVTSVNLKTCWAVGCCEAEGVLSQLRLGMSITDLQAHEDTDILCPFGELLQVPNDEITDFETEKLVSHLMLIIYI